MCGCERVREGFGGNIHTSSITYGVPGAVGAGALSSGVRSRKDRPTLMTEKTSVVMRRSPREIRVSRVLPTGNGQPNTSQLDGHRVDTELVECQGGTQRVARLNNFQNRPLKESKFGTRFVCFLVLFWAVGKRNNRDLRIQSFANDS